MPRSLAHSSPCASQWAQSAMEPRHLRGLEVGCGKHKQCVWLPMPHFKEAWCNGVDFLYSIDYEGMVDRAEIVASRDVAAIAVSELRLSESVDGATVTTSSGAPPPSAHVLRLTGSENVDGPLSWLALDGFADRRWRARLPLSVGGALRGPRLGLTTAQMTIMADCMHSLATSRD